MKRIWLASMLVATVACSTPPTPEQQIINDAATALGGADRIQAVKTLVIEGAGTEWAVGSDLRMDMHTRTYGMTDYRIAIDLAGGRTRVQGTRTPNTPSFSGQAPVKSIQGLDGDIAFNVGGNGMPTRVTDQVDVNERRADYYHHPLTIVRAALNPMAKVSNVRTVGDEQIVDVTTANGVPLTLAISNTTKLPTRVVSMTASDDILGDVAMETAFEDYQDVGGVKVPARFRTKVDKYEEGDIKVTTKIDADAGDLAAPQAVTAAAQTPEAEQPSPVNVEEIGKGVWFLTGTTHHSLLVEFADHLTLIESPNETRGLAVIAKIKELHPEKPLTTLVNTHHHLDHSGGVRAAVAKGITTIVTHRSNVEFYKEGLTRPHTIIPDELSKMGTVPQVTWVPVDDELTLKDDTMSVVLYRIQNNTHADNNLMVYIPSTRTLSQADIYMPRDPRTRGYAPWVGNLADNIKMHNLKIDRMVPLHGLIVPYSEFQQAVKDGYDRTIVKEPPPYPFVPTTH